MDNRRHFLGGLWFLAALVVLSGCSNEPRQYDVQGTVKFQGQPVANGQILFEDEGGSGRWPGVITDGRYQLKATAGPKIVRISATQETGRILEGAMDTKIPEVREIIPEKYNTASQERRTIEPKAQEIDFDLQ